MVKRLFILSRSLYIYGHKDSTMRSTLVTRDWGAYNFILPNDTH